MALIEPGDTILGLALDHGGHLSHGMKINVSGKLYNPVPYHVRREDLLVDMDEVARLAEEHKPKLIVAGWSAYPRQLDFAAFREIADSVGARLMVDMAHFAGLVAAGEHPNPVPHADVVTTTIHKTLCGPRSGMILCREEHAKAIDKAVFPGQQGGPLMHTIAAKAVALRIAASEPFRARQRQTIANAQALAAGLEAGGVPVLTGGTDVHLVLVDLTPTGLDGKTAEDRLEEVGITVNRNAIPFDERPPMNPSGLRIGTPALTTRGLGEDDMREIAAVIATALVRRLRAEKDALAERTARPDGALSAVPAARSPSVRLTARCIVWVDCTAAAHPLVLRPIIERLEAQGHEVFITAREYGQTLGILDRLGLPYTRSASTAAPPSSARAGARRALGAARRLVWPRRPAAGDRPRLGRPRGRLLAVPVPLGADAGLRVRAPAASDRLPRRAPGARPGLDPGRAAGEDRRQGAKLVRYPGLKEEYYLDGFEPDPAVLDELGLDREKVLVVVRPPPETSEYHAPNDLYGGDDAPPRRGPGRRRW